MPTLAVSIAPRQGKIILEERPSWEKGRGEEMFAPTMTDGLLSGLEMQHELSELLEELYYESLW